MGEPVQSGVVTVDNNGLSATVRSSAFGPHIVDHAVVRYITLEGAAGAT